MKLALKKFLRSPKVIIAELVALAVLCALGATLPQLGTATQAELARWHHSGRFVTALAQVLALDHIFRSAWFLVVTASACASLVVIVFAQVKRLRSQWTQRLSEIHFRTAPLQKDFEREAGGGTASLRCAPSDPKLQIWAERRIGLLGSPVFHAGLLLVILAGALRALFGTEAAVDLVEGETLPPTALAWTRQSPGVLGRNFQLDCPITLDAVKVVHYPDGDLRELKVRLSLQRHQGVELAELAVNRDLRPGGGRIFLGADFGPVALLEWQSPGGAPKREAALLAETTGRVFEGDSAGPHGLRAYLRAQVSADGTPVDRLEVRVMRDGGLLFTGEAQAGQTVVLHSGEKLVLHGTPFWVRLHGSRDPALGLAYLGFALVMVGAVLIFAVVKVDVCVLVTPMGERERVFVALKPQRFAPLFQERFEQLVRELAAGTFPANPNVRAARGRPVAGGVTAPVARRAACLLPLLFVCVLTGCHPSPSQQARQLIERYNQVVAEAYRRGDVRLVDSVVGPNEGKKLTGLIGVRLDLGLTLDSQLLSLEVTGVEKTKDEMRVQTQERWRYRDRKIGTGEQVGEESLDSYQMLYIFKKMERAWLVDEIRFTSTPQVGRTQTTWVAERPAPHAVAKEAKQKEITPP